MIDEDKAKAEAAAQEDTDEKLRQLEVSVESIEWFIEYQALSSSYGFSPNPSPPVGKLFPFLSLPVCRRLLPGEWGEGVGCWGRSQIIRRRESLVL